MSLKKILRITFYFSKTARDEITATQFFLAMRTLKLSFLFIFTIFFVMLIACQKEQQNPNTALTYEEMKSYVLESTDGKIESIVIDPSVIFGTGITERDIRGPVPPPPPPPTCNVTIYAFVASGARLIVKSPSGVTLVNILGPVSQTISLPNTNIQYVNVTYQDLPGLGGGLAFEVTGGTFPQTIILPAGSPTQTFGVEICCPPPFC